MTTIDIFFLVAVLTFGPSRYSDNAAIDEYLEYLKQTKWITEHDSIKNVPIPVNCEKYLNVTNQYVRTKTNPQFDMYWQ